jgi:hypothetical protein
MLDFRKNLKVSHSALHPGKEDPPVRDVSKTSPKHRNLLILGM